MIKLCDLHQPQEVYEAVRKVLDSGTYVKGPLVTEFEEKWAKRCGMRYAIGVGSGALALELAIQVLFKDQGTISTFQHIYKAVPNAIRRMGKTVYYAPRPDIYVHHLHDQFPAYKPILEDASHCHGYQPIADTAIFSFYPTKILGAVGDAGIIVTNNKKVYEECLELRNHGEPVGTNARLDEIQAAVLLAKLPSLDWCITRRRTIVNYYDAGLVRKTDGKFHYAYCMPGSEEKAQKLRDAGIETGFYYTPEYMALPLHPFLTEKEVEKVVEEAKKL